MCIVSGNFILVSSENGRTGRVKIMAVESKGDR